MYLAGALAIGVLAIEVLLCDKEHKCCQWMSGSGAGSCSCDVRTGYQLVVFNCLGRDGHLVPCHKRQGNNLCCKPAVPPRVGPAAVCSCAVLVAEALGTPLPASGPDVIPVLTAAASQQAACCVTWLMCLNCAFALKAQFRAWKCTALGAPSLSSISIWLFAGVSAEQASTRQDLSPGVLPDSMAGTRPGVFPSPTFCAKERELGRAPAAPHECTPAPGQWQWGAELCCDTKGSLGMKAGCSQQQLRLEGRESPAGKKHFPTASPGWWEEAS